jgi:hypothetical protein
MFEWTAPKMLPCHSPHKLKSNRERTTQKTLHPRPKMAELEEILYRICSHQGLWSNGLNAGLSRFGCGKRNTPLNPIAIASWSARGWFFGKPIPQVSVSPFPVLNLPIHQAKKGRCS